MSLKQSNNGQFTIPTAPSLGVAVAQSASANTYGSYVQLTASTTEADFITGIRYSVITGGTAPQYISIMLGTGGSGSETTVGIVEDGIKFNNASAAQEIGGFVPIIPPIPVAISTRIAAKTASSLASALSWNIALTVCKQSDLVDAGIPEQANLVQSNGNSCPAGAIPNAVAGAAGGLMISGANTGPWSVSNGVSFTGLAASGGTPATAGLTLAGGAASTSSGGTAAPGFQSTGGAGAASTNGAAIGTLFQGGGTNTVSSTADGFKCLGTSTGNGAEFVGAGAGVGINAAVGGVVTGAISATTITASGATTLQSLSVSTTTSLASVSASTITASGTVTFNAFTVTNAFTVSGGTTFTGAAASGSTPATAGFTIAGGAASITSGGVAAPAIQATGGAGAASTNGAAIGVLFQGGGTNTVASTATGFKALGTSTGHGIDAESGGGTSGDGFHAASHATGGFGGSFVGSANAGIFAQGKPGIWASPIVSSGGQGILCTGDGGGEGFLAIGGATGVGIHGTGGGTSGAGFRAEAQGGNSNAMELVPNGTGAGLSANKVTATTITTSGTVTFNAFAVTTTTTLTGAVTATNASNDIRGIQVNSMTAAAAALFFTLNSGKTSADAVTGSIIAEITHDVWDEVLTGATHNVPSSSGRRLRQIASITTVDSSVNDAGPTSTSFVTALTNATDNFYNDQTIIFTSGVLSGQSRLVTTYNGTTKTITVDEAFTSAPGNGDTFTLYANHTHPITQIATAIWQDTTASDFTVAGSIGKSLFTSGNAPGAASGLALVGSAMAVSSYAAGQDPWTLVFQTPNTIEGLTFQQQQRIVGADAAGLSSGNEANAPVIKGLGSATTRITATTDANGNRTSVTLNP